MEKAAIIDSIELFLKTDSEIEKWFELAINNSAREDKIDDLKESIARREKYTETLCEETELSTRQVKHFKRFSPKKAKDYIERRELKRKENRFGERLAQLVMPMFSPLMPSKYRPISAALVAKAMVNISKSAPLGFNIYHFKEIMEKSN